MAIQLDDLVYAVLTVFVTVVFVIVIRIFGRLPVSLVGPDLNLLTYGFLWDTSTKALRGTEYWPGFAPLALNINKPTTLFVIALVNLIVLGANMKLAYWTEQSKRKEFRDWILRPLVTALGVFSLIVFLVIESVWEGK